MKNLERGTIKYLIVLIIVVSIAGMITYPVLDLIYNKFITNDKFVYSVFSYIVQPIIFGVVFGITFWVVDKKRK